jgi:CDP-diglyceride synthetase
MTLLNWMGEHPILTFILVLMAFQTIGWIFESIFKRELK